MDFWCSAAKDISSSENVWITFFSGRATWNLGAWKQHLSKTAIPPSPHLCDPSMILPWIYEHTSDAHEHCYLLLQMPQARVPTSKLNNTKHMLTLRQTTESTAQHMMLNDWSPSFFGQRKSQHCTLHLKDVEQRLAKQKQSNISAASRL